MSIRVGQSEFVPDFPVAAHTLLGNKQMRANVRRATDTIRNKRGRMVAEMPDWEELRNSAQQIKQTVLRNLGAYLEQFEKNCTAAGGHVHWARDADEANNIVIGIMKGLNQTEMIK